MRLQVGGPKLTIDRGRHLWFWCLGQPTLHTRAGMQAVAKFAGQA